jgi:hypothetical protein
MPKTRVLSKHEKHIINDKQRLLITVLTKLGGFSTRAIACRIFATTNPTAGEITAVSGYKSRNGIKCKWWRDNESLLAKKYFSARCAEAIKRSKD